MPNPNSNAASIAVETVSRNMLASDPNRAAYFWMVRDATNIATLPIDSLPVLIAEYDSSGQLHLLSEVVAPPPYVWCAQSYRATQGIVCRHITILVGYEPIWMNRLQMGFDGSAKSCLMFGRRNIATRAEEILLLYPDGSSFDCSSMQSAIDH